MQQLLRTRPFAAALASAFVLTSVSLNPLSADVPEHSPLPVSDPGPYVEPPERGPNGEPPPAVPDDGAEPFNNRVKALTSDRISELNSNGFGIVENVEGQVVLEYQDEQDERHRVAVFETTTDGGVRVVGLAFLDETEIAEMEGTDPAGALLAPQVAYGHASSANHTHSFWTCSYVFNYRQSYQMKLHLCPLDFDDIKYGGMAAAAALGIGTGHPWLGWITGVAYRYGTNFCRAADSSCEITVGDYRATYGWAQYSREFYCTFCNFWFYFYSIQSSLFGYAERSDTGSLYYIYMSGV